MSNDGDNNNDEKPIHLRLFDFSEEEIKEFNHYQILGLDEPVRATPYTIKQAYRKASIRYHPDKTGRGEDNYVFIAVKSAWDTLSDTAKRQAYDSTEMPFDDSIPPDVAGANGAGGAANGLLYSDDDFYDTFGPVFERNLRFDTRLQQQTSKNGSQEIPSLGGVETPIEQVQAFYDYWTQFTSWRDFSQKAQEELFDNNNPLEDAESRYEKRFYQKEIDKRAKALKRQEMNRIQTLVQRSMAADPRLQKHYREQKEAKEKAALERKLKKEQEEKDRQEAEQKRQQEEAERQAQEKEQRAQEKAQREKEKKQLRKAKQQLRKITVSTYQEQSESGSADLPFKSLEDMSDEVEYLCTELNLLQIQELTQIFTEQKDFTLIQTKAEERRNSNQEEMEAKKKEMAERQQKQQEADRIKAEELAQAKAWSQLELNALAKAIKKFPKTGGNRWEQIASFINNMCRPDVPRTREECIQQFNSIQKATMAKLQEKETPAAEAAAAPAAKPATAEAPALAAAAPAPAPVASKASSPPQQVNGKRGSVKAAESDKKPAPPNGGTANGKGNNNNNKNNKNSNGNNPKAIAKSESTMTEASAASASGGGAAAGDNWSDEQDKQLQEGLAKFPATMDKNERWTSIAKMVTGKSKKQCVQRFKAIRDAIKSGKK